MNRLRYHLEIFMRYRVKLKRLDEFEKWLHFYALQYSTDNRCRELRPYHEEPLFSFSFSCFLLL